jgi:glycosyltransferase involved in cell wall biosynthesis
LATRGFETHLFFIGDPALPGYEVKQDGKLHLHRWGQWLSAFNLGGVYEGEEEKLRDWDASLPSWLESELLPSKVAAGESVVILAEEWQTAATVVRLHEIVERHGWSKNVRLLWNANNTFSFDRIDWKALDKAATVTTVSRYMKREMWDRGVDPRVIPNGIEDAWLRPAPMEAVATARRLFNGRLSILKVGRFDPNKRWLAAIDAVAMLKQMGHRPLLIARGGNEGHGRDVYARAAELGLAVENCAWSDDEGLYEALRRHLDADVVFLEGHLSFDDRKALYQASHAVLANSAIEPFGLVGLEAMASGGLVLVGSTGEDYSLSGHDSISLQTASPGEIVHHLLAHTANRALGTKMRKAARSSAGRFTWSSVLDRALLPLLRELGVAIPVPITLTSRRRTAAAEDESGSETVGPATQAMTPEYVFATASAVRAVAPPIAPA